MSKNIIVEDERTKRNTGKICAWAIAITYVYLLVEMGYKLFSKQAGNSGWELVLLLLISMALYNFIYSRLFLWRTYGEKI